MRLALLTDLAMGEQRDDLPHSATARLLRSPPEAFRLGRVLLALIIRVIGLPARTHLSVLSVESGARRGRRNRPHRV